MNLPNILTMSRFGFAVIIGVLLMTNTLAGNISAAVLFIAASLTDYYDGYLAKKNGLISDFGKIMDPIADKVMILSIFTVLAFLGMVDGWMVIAIGVREVAVTVSRLKAMAQGQVLPAEAAGKIKTVFQILTIAVILLFLIAEQAVFALSWFYKVEMAWRTLINVLMIVSVALTVGSGYLYFKHKKQAR